MMRCAIRGTLNTGSVDSDGLKSLGSTDHHGRRRTEGGMAEAKLQFDWVQDGIM